MDEAKINHQRRIHAMFKTFHQVTISEINFCPRQQVPLITIANAMEEINSLNILSTYIL